MKSRKGKVKRKKKEYAVMVGNRLISKHQFLDDAVDDAKDYALDYEQDPNKIIEYADGRTFEAAGVKIKVVERKVFY